MQHCVAAKRIYRKNRKVERKTRPSRRSESPHVRPPKGRSFFTRCATLPEKGILDRLCGNTPPCSPISSSREEKPEGTYPGHVIRNSRRAGERASEIRRGSQFEYVYSIFGESRRMRTHADASEFARINSIFSFDRAQRVCSLVVIKANGRRVNCTSASWNRTACVRA